MNKLLVYFFKQIMCLFAIETGFLAVCYALMVVPKV